jgi:hypothetical protein
MMGAARGDRPGSDGGHVRRRHPLAAAVAAVLLAGCGGGSTPATSGSGGSGKPLAVGAWKHKVNAICASVTKQSRAVPAPSSPDGLESYLKKLKAIGDAEIARLETITPPAQYARGQRAVIADLTAIWGTLGSLLHKRLSGADLIKAAQSFGTTIRRPAEDYLARTRAAGLSSCILTPASAG